MYFDHNFLSAAAAIKQQISNRNHNSTTANSTATNSNQTNPNRCPGTCDQCNTSINTISSVIEQRYSESYDHMFASGITFIGKYATCLHSSLHHYADGNFGIDAASFGRNPVRNEPNVDYIKRCCSSSGIFIE